MTRRPGRWVRRGAIGFFPELGPRPADLAASHQAQNRQHRGGVTHRVRASGRCPLIGATANRRFLADIVGHAESVSGGQPPMRLGRRGTDAGATKLKAPREPRCDAEFAAWVVESRKNWHRCQHCARPGQQSSNQRDMLRTDCDDDACVASIAPRTGTRLAPAPTENRRASGYSRSNRCGYWWAL